jgi:hypothetical protein
MKDVRKASAFSEADFESNLSHFDKPIDKGAVAIFFCRVWVLPYRAGGKNGPGPHYLIKRFT